MDEIVIRKGSPYRIRPWSRRIQDASDSHTASLTRVFDDGTTIVRTWSREEMADESRFANAVMEEAKRYVSAHGEACVFELLAYDAEGIAVGEPYMLDLAPRLDLPANTIDATLTDLAGASSSVSERAMVSTVQVLQVQLMETQKLLLRERRYMTEQISQAYRQALDFKNEQLQALQSHNEELRERVSSSQTRELEALDERRAFLTQRAEFDQQLAEARGERMQRLENKAIDAGVGIARDVLRQVVDQIDPQQLASLIQSFATAKSSNE